MSEAIATQPPDALPAGQRRARDAYFTPDALALACVRALDLSVGTPRTILEPGCGGGAFLRAAHAVWPRAFLRGIDLLPACDGPGVVERGDLFAHQARYDLVVGNPAFGMAEEVVRHCLGLLEPGGALAFLLRLSFLGSLSRVALYREHPLFALTPIAGRPTFTGGGTDQHEYGLFVWRAGYRGAGRILPPLEWR